jgi:hypothetical protein
MMMVEDISRDMIMKTIIATKNIIDSIIIELLGKIAEFKKNKTQAASLESNKVSTSTFIETIKPPSPTSSKDVNKMTHPIS